VDAKLSELFQIPRSVKTTCVKPSGTVSLLAGATPGIHAPFSSQYIRRVRINSLETELLTSLKDAGYHIEPDVYAPRTEVVEVPV
jgi:ribonucleoside-triphosphate reductase